MKKRFGRVSMARGRSSELDDPTHVGFQIERDTKTELRRFATENDTTMSHIVRTAIEHYLADDNRDLIQKLSNNNEALVAELERQRDALSGNPRTMLRQRLAEQGLEDEEIELVETVWDQWERHEAAVRRMADLNGGADDLPPGRSAASICWRAKRYVGGWQPLIDLMEDARDES